MALGGYAALAGGEFDESFDLPGTESQVALDSLGRTFPQAGGTTAQVVVVVPPGSSVRESRFRTTIENAADAYERIDQVDQAVSPFDKYARGVIAADNRAAIISLRFDGESGNPTPETFTALEEQTAELQSQVPGGRASVGGEAFGDNRPSVSIAEGIGVLVALVVLVFTLGSLRAAGMPLLTALLGVGITMALVIGATSFAVISSTTPLLALMLGLAVGIDYALFITSRHRDQLRDGMAPEESVAQALATAGSAVVFAGLTVIIALCGLAVARIPFLTTMGVAAAIGVGAAVLIALTLLPALLGFAGERLRPKPRRTRRAVRGENRPRSRAKLSPRATSGRLPRAWVRLVTKVPVLTVLLVVVGLGAMAYPAKDLQIALPSNGVAAPGSPARVTYDLISAHFGDGYNGPLIVSATIVSTDDPLEVMDGIADRIRELPGVASVPLSTPNSDASTGIVQVVPERGPDTPETKQLVRDIRALQPEFLERYDVPIYVTGYTAVAIDVSDRLGAALLPFGILVVGLSLVLLTIVFRSIAVPLKATIGYLLSVGAAFGATAMVFEYGWFSELFNVEQTAPVISFLPILLMGILFGLAMDYEVFLVSRIREEFVHRSGEADADPTRDAHRAIEDGFAASARVVIAAGVIMFAVFAAFVPEGEGAILRAVLRARPEIIFVDHADLAPPGTFEGLGATVVLGVRGRASMADTWATFDLDSRLERVEAAVVNADEPVRLNGQLVPCPYPVSEVDGAAGKIVGAAGEPLRPARRHQGVRGRGARLRRRTGAVLRRVAGGTDRGPDPAAVQRPTAAAHLCRPCLSAGAGHRLRRRVARCRRGPGGPGPAARAAEQR